MGKAADSDKTKDSKLTVNIAWGGLKRLSQNIITEKNWRQTKIKVQTSPVSRKHIFEAELHVSVIKLCSKKSKYSSGISLYPSENLDSTMLVWATAVPSEVTLSSRDIFIGPLYQVRWCGSSVGRICISVRAKQQITLWKSFKAKQAEEEDKQVYFFGKVKSIIQWKKKQLLNNSFWCCGILHIKVSS